MAELPEGFVQHPSGGHYHPDHIQTPKTMPAVTKPAPKVPEVHVIPTASGAEVFADLVPVVDATEKKPEIPALVVPPARA